MLELNDLKKMHDKGYVAGQVAREQASDDMIFYHVSQWDDNLLEDVNLSYRGQFDVLRKAGRQVLSTLKANPVQVDFEPVDEDREDAAELLDGMYRADDRKNSSIEAYDKSTQDSVVCGVGAWELYTAYKSRRNGDSNQVILRRYIPEAVNTVFWDPNDHTLDKRDSKFCSVLTAYSEDGYKDLVEELTGERPDNVMESFKTPEHSYTFPWAGGESYKIYVTSFYHRAKVEDKVITFADPFGEELKLRELDILDQMDELIDAGYEIVGEKDIKRWQVTKYIASGAEILSSEVIAGEFIPVIPIYGEHTIIEGEEYYEGITRLAKDPQRLRNFQMSYLADIVSKSPRAKPIFIAEQIQGFEDMYDISGADNDFPYLLQNFQDANGQQLPIGPVGQLTDPPIPQALAASIELTKQAVDDVAGAGLPQNLADPDLSGKAVIALQNQIDKQSYVYQHHLKFAKRRDGEVYASMASDIMDTPQKITVAKPDGTTAKVEVMQSVVDNETGEIKVLNDVTNMEFEVFADIGPAYSTQKEATIEQLSDMAQAVAASDPSLHKAFILKIAELMDGVNFDDIRGYARKQLIISGFKEPETPEDEELLAQSQQNQQPDAATLLAMAEDKKGQAAIFEAETKRMVAQGTLTNEQAKRQVDVFKAQTERMGTQVDAQEAGATINYKNIQAFGQQIDNAQKVGGQFRTRLQ